MTNKETVDRNIGLTFDFLRQVVNDPSILDNLPDKTVIEFIDNEVTIAEKANTVNKPNKYIRVKRQFEVL
jgi:hypothetical protein